MNTLPLSAAELCEAMHHGRPFDAARLNRILCIDERRGLAEVQAATPWATVAAELRRRDARSAEVPTPRSTVGESVAHNAAGPDGKPAVAHVEALTLVTPEGEFRRLSRHRDRELFSLAVGGHGLFGAFYSITLRLESLATAVEQARPRERVFFRPGSLAPRPLQLLLPPEALEAFIAEADVRCRDWRLPLRSVELRRTTAEDDTFLRWASRDFAELKLSFCACEALGERVRAVQLRRGLIDAAITAGGRLQIASTCEATREQVDACYPQLQAFLAHKRRFDRQERLTNGWYLEMCRLLDGEPCEVRWNN